MILSKLPDKAQMLFEKLEIQGRLEKHLRIVHQTALELSEAIHSQWTSLVFNLYEVLFGAATHDIGKHLVKEELFKPGNKHQQAGYDLLVSENIEPSLARFALTHGSVLYNTLLIEDLIVIMADKLWKGKRIDELEEAFISKISKELSQDFWFIYTKAENIFSKLAEGADKRLLWQQE